NTNSSPYVFLQPVGANVLEDETEYTVSFYAWFKESDIEDPPPTPFRHGLRYGGYADQQLTLEYDKPVKITHTFTPTDVSGNLQFILFIPPTEKHDEVVQISNFKLEKGNKATDWSPAPEDALDRITKAEANIKINSEAIELKAEKSELTNFVDKQQYNEKIGQLDVSINGRSEERRVGKDCRGGRCAERDRRARRVRCTRMRVR